MTTHRPSPVADCHLHLFDPERFPYAENVGYRPQPNETATVEQLLAVMAAHGVSHGLLVTPTAGYGADNGATAAALAAHPDKFRGVAVVEPEISDARLADLRSHGFVGVRLDFVAASHVPSHKTLPDFLRRLQDHAAVVEIQARGADLARVCAVLASTPGTFVIDHLGLPDPGLGLAQDGFQALLGLADTGRVYVKLSGAFRIAAAPSPDPEVGPFAQAVLDVFGPERCLWGSDWPFVNMNRRVDYGPALLSLQRWIGNPAARHAVLWEVPARLFGFAAPPP